MAHPDNTNILEFDIKYTEWRKQRCLNWIINLFKRVIWKYNKVRKINILNFKLIDKNFKKIWNQFI